MPCLSCCWKKTGGDKEDVVVEEKDSGDGEGNPRNKCALQPGHSLMDWIRLGASGKDLTGVGAAAGRLSITPAQLAQHDKETDAWLAIRGKVYNVTAYFPFHPGGPEELKKGIGKDATTLFDQVHPWVNYDSILQKCYIGQLVAIDPSVDREALFFGNDTKKPESPKKIQSPRRIPTPQTSSPNSTESNKNEEEQETALPRFDWIQKMDYINIIFYTKPFSNPLVEIQTPDKDGLITILLTYDDWIFSNELSFLKGVEWPCKTKLVYETGKVEIQFRKSAGGVWENYGMLKQKRKKFVVVGETSKHQFKVIKKLQVSHNTFLLEFERLDGAKMVVPLGKHVRAFGAIKGEEISRSYTPVPCSLFTKYKCQPYSTDSLCLMVKRYSDGNLSKFLCDKNNGDLVEMSKPLGSFTLQELENRETFLVLAAGTGITPMFSLILFLLERRIRKCHCITLLFFNKSKGDILFKYQMDSLQQENTRFHVQYILSEPNPDWNGAKGHINPELLQTNINQHLSRTGHIQDDIFAMVCGPTQFTNLAERLLKDLGLNQKQTHLFLG